jgi:hypothetical protein
MIRAVLGAALALTLGQATSAQAQDAQAVIRIVDVGPGLCVVASFPDGYDLVYDAGHWNGSGCRDAVRDLVLDDRIELVILSHTDADHLGELPEILGDKRVGVMLHTGGTRTTATWRDAVAAMGSEVADGATILSLSTWPLAPGTEFNLGDATVTFVFGASTWDRTLSEERLCASEQDNAVSITVRVSYGGQSILLTGDTIGRRLDDDDTACKDAEAFKHRDVAGVIAGYADDDQLLSGLPSPTHPEATQSEYKALRKTADGGIETLDDLPPGPMDPLALAKTQEWLATPLHLFHFNAHASDPGHPQGFVQIGLRLGAQLSGEDVVSGAQVTGAIVLDVCNAAHGTRNYWNNCLAASFHRRGVPVVLAAASTVADAFGAEFSEVFYGEVPLNDYMLFQALRATQRILLDRTRHPMALYYVYEGSPSFELGRY